MKTNNYAVIMAGGQGTRLWPLSRKKNPKQLHSLMTDEPMIKDTYLRLLPVFSPDKIIISTIPEFVADIKKILPEIPAENYIVEPCPMGTAAACGLVSEILYARDKGSVALFMPADAFIQNVEEFLNVIRFAQELVENHPKKILTIGIKPTRPDVNYGYIKAGGSSSSKNKLFANKVEGFKEKPDLKTAEKYFKAGDYLWNAGIFGWRNDHILELFKKNMPETYIHLEKIRENIGKENFPETLRTEYAQMGRTSIDYGIIEKTKGILVIPADFGWSDVGSWGSLLEVLVNMNKSSSVHRGYHVGVDNSNCLVLGGKKLIATIGLKDIVVVDTDDVTLICSKEQSHRVKEVLQKLDNKFL